MNLLYLDNNATTKVDEKVLEQMIPYFSENYGNPSSIYAFAQKNRRVVEEARNDIADLFNVDSSELVFTSGGSESNNMAIKGIANAHAHKGKHIITSSIEHHSVLDTFKYLGKNGFEVSYVSVDKNGVVNLEELKDLIRDDTILISIMHANNEIGTIQPIDEIGKICTENNVIFHVDAVQTAGKYRLDPKKNNIDLMSISGHKFYSPKGIGALYIRRSLKIEKFIHGGLQERNRRAGTENVPGIIGMATALKLAYESMDEDSKNERQLRDYFETEIVKRMPEIYINAKDAKRLHGTTSLTIRYVEGEAILLNLDMQGIAVSSGSACASGDLNASHVLLGIGVPIEDAHGTIRISIGKYNTKEEIDIVLEKLPQIIEKLRSLSPFWDKKG